MKLTVDRDYVVQLLADLVAIDSVNPSLVEGGAGEEQIAGYLAERMAELGLEVERHEPEPARPSVVGRLRGKGGGRSLMLNAHMDTVGVEGMKDPFRPLIREGKLFGRGSYDMKGSLAACLGAVKCLQDAGSRLSGEVLVAGVADEEYASLGTADLLRHYRPQGAIVTEPTQLELCLAHKGFIWLEVETQGRAAHGSRPDLGVDANLHMGAVLGGLAQLQRELQVRPPHPLLGHASLHAARLRGGSAWSVYAERCLLQIERRTLPGETEEQVRREVESLLERLQGEDSQFQARMRTVLVREPFEVSAREPLVQCLREAAAGVLGREPREVGEMPWMDAALLAGAGIPTVVMGPVGGGAHTAREWVDLDSLCRLAAILAACAARWCA